MIKKNIGLMLSSLFILSTPISQANTLDESFNHPFYAGLIAGYGSTTWDGLVPETANPNIALRMSAALATEEGGGSWGILGGYEFSPYFAIEANYLKYASAKIYFDPHESLFSFYNNGANFLTSNSKSLSLMAKVMLLIPDTKVRVFSSAGAALNYRDDLLMNSYRVSPTFGAGVNYNITPHFMAELAGNFIVGYGQAQLSPADNYFPFLYSATARLAYRF